MPRFATRPANDPRGRRLKTLLALRGNGFKRSKRETLVGLFSCGNGDGEDYMEHLVADMEGDGGELRKLVLYQFPGLIPSMVALGLRITADDLVDIVGAYCRRCGKLSNDDDKEERRALVSHVNQVMEIAGITGPLNALTLKEGYGRWGRGQLEPVLQKLGLARVPYYPEKFDFCDDEDVYYGFVNMDVPP